MQKGSYGVDMAIGKMGIAFCHLDGFVAEQSSDL